MKEAGFDAVRVPVTWSLHMGEAPDYIIDAEFLARVAEVVSYVREAGLTAIVNVHHDGADDYEGVEWLTLTDANGAISAETNASVEARFIAVWTQLAETFKSADSYVLFESMNEIHDGYDAPDPAYFETINQLNQTFVNIVRASGGNNGERCLVVPGYNTNIDETLAGFKRPNDPTPDRLILSVHYYDPWPFAGEGSTHAWGASSPNADSWGQEDYVAQQFDKLVTSFVSQGLPMIVGEYGAVHQAGYEDERRYYMEHVTKVITDRGIVPFYWDNGSEESGPDGFGLFSRADGSTLYPNVLDAMMRAATSDYSLDEITAPDR